MGTEDFIALSDINVDWTLAIRDVDTAHVRSLEDALESDPGSLPPLIVEAVTLRLVDGFHRYRAHEKLGITRVRVEKRRYSNEGELFADAVRCNASHGRRLTRWDMQRIVERGEHYGFKKDQVAEMLRIKPESIERRKLQGTIERRGAKAEVVPLKRTFEHLNGKKLTKSQVQANEKAGGMRPLFYVNQVINCIEGEALDLSNVALLERLGHLRGLLAEIDLEVAA